MKLGVGFYFVWQFKGNGTRQKYNPHIIMSNRWF